MSAVIADHAGFRDMCLSFGSSPDRARDYSGFPLFCPPPSTESPSPSIHDGPGKTYYQRSIAEGDSRHRARRALKRRITRVVYNRVKASCRPATTTAALGGFQDDLQAMSSQSSPPGRVKEC